MSAQFTHLPNIEALDDLISSSGQERVVLFKHDPHCPISARAYREMEQLTGAVALIDVEEHNDMAQEIAGRTSIEHQSPQVIVLQDGQAVWSASLYDINHDEVEQALRQS